MDVFHVGASAPKAPESKGVEREPERTAARVHAHADRTDAFTSSPDAAAVQSHVAALQASSDVREGLVDAIAALLGRGFFDTPDAAQRAAQGILDT